MCAKDNYLTLTEEQKDYVRENSTKLSVETMVRELYPTSRHEVMRFILNEKLSMRIIKTKKKKYNAEDNKTTLVW